MKLDDIAVCTLSEYNADGWLGIQVDVLGGKDGSSYPYETLHPFGFMSRPPDPEVGAEGLPSKGCKALVAYDGDEGFVLPLSDQATVASLPILQKGESQIYASGGSNPFCRATIKGEVTRMTTHDNTPDGRLIYDQIGPDGYELVTPWGTMRLGPYGFHVSMFGGRCGLGVGAGSAPEPLASLGVDSYAYMKAAVVDAVGNLDGGSSNAAARTALKAWVSAVSLAFTHATPASGMTADNAAVQSALAALLLLFDALGEKA